MKSEKRKRLTAKGWKVGSAQELLGLSDAEMQLIDMKLAAARRIKQRRQALRLTQERFARLMRTSQSRVAKIEAGHPSVSFDQLVRSLLVLGDTPSQIAKAMADVAA